jgi:hypothetical protein
MHTYSPDMISVPQLSDLLIDDLYQTVSSVTHVPNRRVLTTTLSFVCGICGIWEYDTTFSAHLGALHEKENSISYYHSDHNNSAYPQ